MDDARPMIWVGALCGAALLLAAFTWRSYALYLGPPGVACFLLAVVRTLAPPRDR